MRKEIDNNLASPAPFLSTSGFKGMSNKAEKRSTKYGNSVDNDSSKSQNKKSKKKSQVRSEKSADKTDRKRPTEDFPSKAPKKLRT